MASILMVASENGLLPDCKVGGIADVVADLSVALVRDGNQVTVVTPGYGNYVVPPFADSSSTPSNQNSTVEQIHVSFCGQAETGEISTAAEIDGVRSLVIEHPLIHLNEPGQIYVHDTNEPFATDSGRFALFSLLTAEWIRKHDNFDVVHLHDWHAANVAILRSFSDEYAFLKTTPLIYTIHNLALQGVRPLRDNSNSLEAWFPGLGFDDRIVDPRWTDCVNLMRAGILLTDRVNTVSETYAAEIQEPNDETRGRHGGEGLESDLRELATAGRLTGILNGCDYGKEPEPRLSAVEMLAELRRFLRDQGSAKSTVPGGFLTALDNITQLNVESRPLIATSIGRAVPQKLGLLQVNVNGKSVLDHLIEVAPANTLFVILASGDPVIEQFLVERAAIYPNLIYIPGFSARLADTLYRAGDLFLMPSLFEPCGLSQLLSMRNGQPCIVNDVGGLKDTIDHGETGWKFSGNSLLAMAEDLIMVFSKASKAASENTKTYTRIVNSARRAKFSWSGAAEKYQRLYGIK